MTESPGDASGEPSNGSEPSEGAASKPSKVSSKQSEASPEPADGGGGEPTQPADDQDPFAGWTPGVHDLIPILPRGSALFEGIPAPAIVVEALSPAIGDGAVVARRPGSVGVILVKDGALFEQYAFEGGTRLDGSGALGLIASWSDATVSAYRFDPVVVAVAPSLFRGSPCYEDLRLEWTDWPGLVADLCSRDGLFVVELDTPAGRGVTLIVDGRQVATYTEAHPELGDATLLDPLAATRRGTIWVRREPLGGQEEQAAPAEVQTAAGAAFGAAASLLHEPAASGETDWSVPPPWRADAVGEAAPEPYGDVPSPGPGGPFAAFGSRRDLPEPPSAPPWGPPGTTPPPGSFPATGAGPSVPLLAAELKQVARIRLQRSSSRVEAMVDEAVTQGMPLDVLLDEIRGLVIRGVMQSTLDEVAEEMAALASEASG